MWLTKNNLLMYYKIFKLEANPKNNYKLQCVVTVQSEKPSRTVGRAVGEFS